MLERPGWIVLRRRIGRIMDEQGLVSKYTVAQYKPSKTTCNESEVGNVLNREFDQDQEFKVIVSDLTYLRVQQKWHYICVLVGLYNREIIDQSAGPHKSAALVQHAFAQLNTILIVLSYSTQMGAVSLKISLSTRLRIERSLGTSSPSDNALAEATFKTIKTEFVYGFVFPAIT